MNDYNYGDPYNYGRPPPPPPPGAPPPSNLGEMYPPTDPYQPFGYPEQVPPPQQPFYQTNYGFHPTPPPTTTHPVVPPYSGTYCSTTPFPSYSSQPSLTHHGSFDQQYSFNHQGQSQSQYPPPHFDPTFYPSTYPTPQSSLPHYSNPPLEGMLANVRISEHAPPPPPGPTDSSGSYPYAVDHASSGSFNSPHTGQNSPFGGSQYAQSTSFMSQPSMMGDRILLLHGNLDVWVIEGKNLPNMDTFSMSLQGMIGKKSNMTSDPYVTFSVANAVLGRTFVISNSENPVWNQHFYVAVAHRASFVKFMVKDSDTVGSQLMGTVQIPTSQLYTGEKVEGVYDILGSNGKPCKAGATMRLSIQYIPIDKMTAYYQGVGPGPNYVGVPGTYFPLRKGGSVTLYQDAHVPDGCLPPLRLEGGKPHVQGKCWVDIAEAISQARKFIYITGWSVYHNVQLVRDVPGSARTLGELLKSKSQEGVRVLLLVWDDPTSTTILGIKRDGLMQTHDEETRRFFKNSSVHVLLCPRSSGKRHGFIKSKETALIYTHHQKTVILDSDAGHNKRKVIAFVGGLDLCDGRYDTPQHPLFRTLTTLHKDDFHNPTFVIPSGTMPPRQPWHDLHTRIDGPAAYDVLQNFEERWLRASQPSGTSKPKTSSDALLQIERIKEIIPRDESPYLNDNDPESWHVQIFRSIDSNSVEGFPKNPREASSKNLVCGKNILVDMSIHTAYVKAIRSAQHFIYIENQYFLGSSYNWKSRTDLGANNLIPMEIALKISNKIKANERFSVYIIIPMWPEGNPTDSALQRILLWQNKTMQMMYDTIYMALVETGLEKTYTPQDYLNFFCLGNREAPTGNSKPFGASATANTPCTRAESSRRFMIYVHSKGMIVDDEYLIVGSANINNRSLEGFRDTEIAMGGYQPRHTWAVNKSAPLGQIYAYRMSLWAEHTGVIEECFKNPSSLECMQRVRTMGEVNWGKFFSNDVTEMIGHLLKYPVDVDSMGNVKPLAGCETFPDVGGNVCGSAGILDIPENLTI